MQKFCVRLGAATSVILLQRKKINDDAIKSELIKEGFF